jgi:hypothetical protein
MSEEASIEKFFIYCALLIVLLFTLAFCGDYYIKKMMIDAASSGKVTLNLNLNGDKK